MRLFIAIKKEAKPVSTIAMMPTIDMTAVFMPSTIGESAAP